jgi:2-dehydro-3-deoxyglucarate aldolase
MQFESYEHTANDYSVVICQIEHKTAVDNIDSILSVQGVDGLIIGPYDISGSYGVPGELNHPLVIEAEKTVLEAAQRHGIPAGIHVVQPDIEQLKDKIQKGFKIIIYGGDMIFLAHACKDGRQEIENVLSSIFS